MLRIEKDVPRGRSIVCVRPNGFDCLDERHPTFLHALWSMQPRARRGRPVQIISDFRCRPKIANRLAHSWVRNVLGWNQYVGETWDRVGSPFRAQPAFAATLTAYPDPATLATTVDGMVQRTGVSESWATIRAGAGTAVNNTGSPDGSTFLYCTATTDTFQTLYRGIFTFDTNVGAGYQVDAATLSLYGTSKSNTFSPELSTGMNIYSAAPASNNVLVSADFTTIGATDFATTISYSSWAVTPAYNDFTLNAAGKAGILLTGITRLGTREPTYDAGGASLPWTSLAYLALRHEFADQAGTTKDPKLVVTYTATPSFKPIVIAA